MKHDEAPPRPEANPVEQADIAATRRFARRKDDPVLRHATAFSKLADQPPILTASAAVAVCGLLAGNPRVAHLGARLFAAITVATWVKGAVKKTVARSRPHLLLDEGVHRVEPLGPDGGAWHSFPSGHTANAAAAARVVARLWPGAALPAYGAAAAVGLVQVPRGSHYPSDVVAGALVGIAAEAIVERLLPSGSPRAPNRVDSP